MSDLKIDYKDDVLNTEVNERRKYQMIQNDDGTVSFVDVTDYSQVGDSFGAVDINATNEKCNEINNSLGEMKHSANIIGNVTGAHGSCNNLVCSCFVYNGIALCTIKMDSCKGVFDIYLSSFGLQPGTTISRVNNSRLATNVNGANGQVLNINCLAGSTSLQIACSTTEDSYNFMFPVIIVSPNNK